MTRSEIIAQLDAEIFRLERARDYLTVALKGARSRFLSKVEIKLPAQLSANPPARVPVHVPAHVPAKTRKQRSLPAYAASPILKAVSSIAEEVVPKVAPIAADPVPTPVAVLDAAPVVKRVPPRRRVERRQVQTDKLAKSPAALSGLVPAGPVVVSANEARKHERVVAAPVMPVVTELRSEIGAERSLGSLIQAFERRTGFNGAETP